MLLKTIPAFIKKIGVFVNNSVDRIFEIAKTYQLDGIQLHGHESPETCRILRSNNYYVMKVIHIRHDTPTLPIADYQKNVDALIFDHQKDGQLGGTGQSFDWSILNTLPIHTPFLLSGGISLDHISAIRQINHPHFIGIDINSRFETEPAMK
ncbi:UNVERIFIED_CONTAM: hypothetical protein GTU68_039770, partial [Idotea baltica]|nr:hypothetical protein [Idotea baltica]